MEEITGIVVLAAGNSSRLGKAKQLLTFNGNTLLHHTIVQAQLVAESAVVVVIGAHKKVMEKELAATAVKVVSNENWESGIASSIAVGLREIISLNPTITACIFTVCDQPFITARVFKDLIAAYEKKEKGIIASSYAQTLGTPVLFGSQYFGELLKLKGQEGAKKLIGLHQDDAAAVDFDKGEIDIDTSEDYDKLLQITK